MKDGCIPIRVANKRAYIWDVDADLMKIRSEHHICGLLVGTLPHLSQQNLFLGLPSQLMPEEATLLVEKGFAVFIDDAKAYPEPSPLQFQQWNAEQREYVKLQQTVLEAETAKPPEVAQRAMSEEAIRKRKERELKRQQKAAELRKREQAEDGTDAGVSQSVFAPTEEAGPSSLRPSTPSLSAVYNISVPAPSSSLNWYSPDSCAYSTVEAAKEAGIWDFPSNLSDRARYGVFKDLWDQGYFMGGGIRFGGEYLVYPGDPLRYHSHFCATVIESPTQVIHPMEIVAHGRLGTATKKTHLFCGWDDEKKIVSYLSIEWAGFG
ncbi:tRNA-intron endonuclease catalytic domain-like protein [Gymnopus androsaceus JB14]|uniref:tRNA-splicing endonuclease subunit Sen34 n=1 Tax=Gymnopus androsaceus JB14 TaxID=1447944 RepID=A0A6A4HU00_9AGAR|nr:tRNA-intron endonuclease catalytic domain-like protein [Gymnopus androsaceus JB14]